MTTEQKYEPVMVQIQSTVGIVGGWKNWVEADNMEHAREIIRLEKEHDAIPPVR